MTNLNALKKILTYPLQIPDNKALEGLAGAMLEAHRIYNRPG